MKIGMRTIKTSIAVTISVWLSYILNLNSPFFAGIASIITMQGNLVDSYKMGKNRMLGTILGAMVGLFGAIISGGNPLLIGLGVIIIIYLCNLLDWNKAITIAGIVFLSIMLNEEGGSRLSYSLNRILDTFVGISVAVIVNFLISPPYIKEKLHETISNYIEESKRLLKSIVLNQKDIIFDGINNLYESIKKEYPVFESEKRMYLNKEEKEEPLNNQLFLIDCLHRNINILQEVGIGYGIDKENSQKIKEILGIEIQSVESNNKLFMVYNYHLRLCLIALNELIKDFNLDSINSDKAKKHE